MSIIKCFTEHGRADLQSKFEDAVKGGKDEYSAARDILMGEHKNLHEKTNGIRKELKIPPTEYKIPPPYKPPISEELPFGKSSTTGISHEKQTERTYDVNETSPIRGEGVSAEDAIKHGKDLLKEGGDPQKASDEFKKDSKISFDALSLVRAEHSNLVRETNKAEEEHGENSQQYKDAKAKEIKWYNETVKPMQTEWHKIGQAQQGVEEIDTGNYVGLKRARTQFTGKDLSPQEVREARGLSDKVKTLNKKVDDLKQKLSDALDKAEKEPLNKKNIAERTKDVANLIRKGKTSKPGSFSAATPASLVWDGALEVMAKTIEVGGRAAQAIADGLAHIRASDWYKNLSTDKKQKADQDYRDFFGADILTKFVDKKDNKFEPEEAKEIWDYAKNNYLDKGTDFDTMIANTSADLGLKPTKVRDALTTPKGTKTVTDEMYKMQSDRNKAIQMAKDWAKSESKNPFVKVLRSIPKAFFAAKVFGHGTVGMITHAGVNMVDPVEWKRYWPTFFKQFSFAYGKSANYEKAMQDLQHDPQYLFWKRNGLAVDPTERYDEYQFISKAIEKVEQKSKFKIGGKEFAPGRALTAGDRGFNALKVYRLARAKALWNGLSNAEKADKETPQEIAKLVNHSTGTTGGKISEVANTAFFAPKLELARWNKLIVDPAKAVKTFANWNNATPSEKAAAKIVGLRAARIMGTYLGALGANWGLLALSGSDQNINLFDPSKKDWLKFKAGGRTIDMTAGMVSLLGFLTRMTQETVGKAPKGGRGDQLYKEVGDYASGKLSPFASTVKDIKTHHDFQGNTLPMFDDKPLHSWNKKLSWSDYFKKQQTPIPVAEYFTDLDKRMQDQGVDKKTAGDVIKSLFIAGMVGGTGVHIGEEAPAKANPFTDVDKKDPTFKYFLDKGMELPNTVNSSETVTNEKEKTKQKVSELPPDEQSKYLDTHKDFLKQELAGYKKRGFVFTKEYKKANGEMEYEVYKDHTRGATKTKVDDLNKDQLAEVLSDAQSQATKKTKKKLGYKE